jgi:hypothetical protein
VSAQFAPRTHLSTLVANIVLFSPNLFGLVPLLVGDFSISARETSGGFKIFYNKNLWAFLAEKLRLYCALAALDFIYHNQENCHMPAIASFGFCSSRCYAAFIGH